MTYSEEQIKDLLKDVVDPNTNDNLINDKSIKSISIKDSDIGIKVLLGYPASPSYLVVQVKQSGTNVLHQPLLLMAGQW